MTTATTAAQVMGKGETDSDGNTIYSVPSRSHPGDVYQVVIDTHRLAHCACKAATYGLLCAHVRCVDLYRAAEAAKAARTLAAKVRDELPMRRDNQPFSIFKAS
jgi:hypothetical protein